MQGEILAAHGPDDGIWIVRRLVNGGALTERQGIAYTRALERGEPFEDLLLSHIPGRVLSAMLEGRFRQNLLDFVTGTSDVRFEPMDTIFVANLQHSHDSLALLRAIVERRARIAPLAGRRLPLTLRPGPSMPATQAEARLLDACDPASSLQRLLTFSPYEPGDTLDAVINMLRSGTVVSDEGVRIDRPILPRRTNMPGPGSLPDARFAVEDLFDALPPPLPPGIPAGGIPATWGRLLLETAGTSDTDDFGDVPEELARRWSGDSVVVPMPTPEVGGDDGLAAIPSLQPSDLEDLRSIHSLRPEEPDQDDVQDDVQWAAPAPDVPTPVSAELTPSGIFGTGPDGFDSELPELDPVDLDPVSLTPVPPLDAVADPVGVAADDDELLGMPAEDDDDELLGMPAEDDDELLGMPAEDDDDELLGMPAEDDEDDGDAPGLHVLSFGGADTAAPEADLFSIDSSLHGATELRFEEVPSEAPSEASGGADNNGQALIEAARRYLQEAQEARGKRVRDGADTDAPAVDAELELQFSENTLDPQISEIPLDDDVVVRPPGYSFDFDVEEGELAVFADNDDVRGDGQGLFTLERRLLDVVDLSPETLSALSTSPPPAREPEPMSFDEDDSLLEMGEASEEEEEEASAVALSFGAPVVSDDQALHRASVAVDVLGRLSDRLDAALRPGAGQIAVQLLLEAAPNQYGSLLHPLTAGRTGRFSPSALVANLSERPVHERRLLLDRCLTDLIERALCTAVEELPEAAVDELLEEIVGYQQRLRG